MAAVITPENARFALFTLIGGPFLIAVVAELLTGCALGIRGFFKIRRREDEPGEYWFSVLMHSAVVAFASWLCFFKLGR